MNALYAKKRLEEIAQRDRQLARQLSGRIPSGINYCVDFVPASIVWFKIKILYRHPDKFVEASFPLGVYCDAECIQPSDALIVNRNLFAQLTKI